MLAIGLPCARRPRCLLPRPAPTRKRSELLPLAVVGGLCLVALSLWWFRGSRSASAPDVQAVAPRPAAPAAPVPTELIVAPLSPAALAAAVPGADGAMHLTTTTGADLTLTLDPRLQAGLKKHLSQLRVPYVAIVLMDPQTGALRAVVEHREAGDPVATPGDLGQARVPAASVFKVVAAAALLQAGQTPESSVCFHGGRHGIDPSNLAPSPRDQRCETLTEALARSTNGAFARFAATALQPGDLTRAATRLGFGAGLASDLVTGPSRCEEGTTLLDRGRCAPGFAGSSLSPLHAAFLAATVAHGGLAMRPYVVAADSSQPGFTREPTPLGQVLPAAVAADLARMMAQTVVAGTGRMAFSQRPASLRAMAIAGKTGSLSDTDPNVYRHFSWFVGFAPAEDPKVAVAVLAINGLRWRAKAAGLARDALGLYFETGEAPTAATAAAPPQLARGAALLDGAAERH